MVKFVTISTSHESIYSTPNTIFALHYYEVKHIIFFRNYWDIVATDIWSLVAEAFGTGTINPDLANTLVVPIPKIDSLTKDFKPISLCNVTLKIISKVFVNHIRPYLDNLIGSLQRDCASHAQEERHTSCRICGFLNIDNYVRRFNWGESTSHRVKWPTLTRSRRDGGLGIQSAREIQMLRCWANTYGLFCLMIKSFGQRCNFINILRTKMFSGLKRLQGVLIYGSQFLKLLRIFALARVTSSFGMIDGYLYHGHSHAMDLLEKLMAILKGLVTAWNMGFRKLICEYDAQLCLGPHSSRQYLVSSYESVLSRICDMKTLD
ncbi:hypothetical protein HKD37_12G035201 [Glycine soja]